MATGSRSSSFQPQILHVTGVAPRDGANHVLHEIEILETTGAAVATDDLLDRAAEVDVDELGLENVRHERGRFAHRGGVGAEDLDANRPLVGPEAELVDGGGVLAPDPFGGKKLRDDDVRASGGRAAGRATPTRPPSGEVERDGGIERKRETRHSQKLRVFPSPSNARI